MSTNAENCEMKVLVRDHLYLLFSSVPCNDHHSNHIHQGGKSFIIYKCITLRNKITCSRSLLTVPLPQLAMIVNKITSFRR